MDLSPLARERLERIGSLSPDEAQELNNEREAERALAPFFAGTADTDALRQQVKELAESHGPDIVRQAQVKLLDAIRIQMSSEDFQRASDAILTLEKLKGSRTNSTLEMLLGSVSSLRQRYAEVRQQAYEQLRRQVDQQVRAQSDPARRQGLFMDAEASMEASIKSTPEWRDFMSRHDAEAERSLHEYVSRIRASI